MLPHLAVQLAIFLGCAIGYGWGILDALWMGVANIAGVGARQRDRPTSA